MITRSSKTMNVFRLQLFTFMMVGIWGIFCLMAKPAKAENVWEPVKVQQGNTLEKIAKRYGSTSELWKKANFLEDYYLTISQTLNIVFPYRVVEGDQLDYLAKKYNTTKFAIKNLNHLESDHLKAGMVISIPVNSNRLLKEIESQRSTQTTAKKKSPKSADFTHKQRKKESTKLHRSKKKQSASTNPSTGKKTFTMRATAYNVEGNEQWGRLTASGTTVRHGVVAVDPNVIPLGTKLYVSGYQSSLLPKGGFVAIAEDTGGAIKGNRIDIFIDAPTKSLRNFGIQQVTVTVLE